ncbi:hypothetical protein RI129_001048 [Pyrocoelia pectoralis]|uniref:Uncharacterized protein n=1 Tax=Pyrocoelia pectoralis TaxID=417401 RepID=A0AAN7VT49_9COLE
MVSINIGNTKCVTLDIPFQTMKEFIYPFANAMNLINSQDSCNTGSQTSFITPIDTSTKKKSSFINITELCVKNNTLVPKQCSDQSENSEYETKIMKSLHDNLLNDNASQVSESDSNQEFLEQTDNENMFNSSLDVQAIAKDVIEKTSFIDKDLTVLKDVIHDFLLITKDLPIYSEEVMKSESQESWASCLSSESDTISIELQHDIALDNVDCNKNVVDGGVNLNTMCTSNCHLENIDTKVMLMSDAIYDYIVKQCFETPELVLFPEIVYDDNIAKLYASLESHYSGNELSDEDKNILRLNIANRVISKFETYEKSFDSSNNSPDVSDKIFTISELVSDILNHFFVEYVDNNMCKEKDLSDSTEFSIFTEEVHENKLVHQSTPQYDSCQSNKVCISNCEVENDSFDDEIVISFKAKETKNLGNEKYWIAITKSPDTGKTVTKKHEVINVDDIPLKPPPDLDYLNNSTVASGVLSPIPEEVACNLFSKFSESDDDDEINHNLNDTSKLEEEEEDMQLRNLLNNKYKTESTYISFDCPETNAVVCNSVSFYRTNTVNTFSYTQPSSITFVRENISHSASQKDDCSNLHTTSEVDSNDDGDWMGYEAAKF